ncbi:hypothetical protein PMAYCL1PPCAC_11741, partial [Pristionchus mayeri]
VDGEVDPDELIDVLVLDCTAEEALIHEGLTAPSKFQSGDLPKVLLFKAFHSSFDLKPSSIYSLKFCIQALQEVFPAIKFGREQVDVARFASLYPSDGDRLYKIVQYKLMKCTQLPVAKSALRLDKEVARPLIDDFLNDRTRPGKDLYDLLAQLTQSVDECALSLGYSASDAALLKEGLKSVHRATK